MASRILLALTVLVLAAVIESRHVVKRQANWNPTWATTRSWNGGNNWNTNPTPVWNGGNNWNTNPTPVWNGGNNNNWNTNPTPVWNGGNNNNWNTNPTPVWNGGNNNNGGQNNAGRCSQGRRFFVDPNDCSSFFECDNAGNAHRKTCGDQLFFNQDTNQCDWRSNVNTQGCQQNAASQSLKPSLMQGCANNPSGNRSQAFLTHNPELCNSFFMCAQGNPRAVCLFCPENMYFPIGSQGCAALPVNTLGNPQSMCENGRQYVPHREKVNMSGSPQCSIFANPQQQG